MNEVAKKTIRSDSENIRILESLKEEHLRLSNKLIRSTAELERAESDLDQLKVELKEKCGTDDLDEVRELVAKNYEQNAIEGV